MTIKNKHGTSEPIHVTEGLLQGEVLSPSLFALFLADLEEFLLTKGIRGVSINTLKEILLLAYADDIVILTESQVMMKKVLKVVQEYCRLNRLIINVKKTNVVVFSKGARAFTEGKFYFGEDEINEIREYVYLGIPFVRSALFEAAAKNMYRKGIIAIDFTIKLIRNTKLEFWNRIELLFDSLIVSVVLYSSPLWCVNYLRILEKLQYTFFKRLLNLPSCTPGYAVRLETGRAHLSLKIFKLVLDWISKVILMPINRYPKVVFMKLLELSKNQNCILKYNWISLVKKHFFEPINELEIWENIGLLSKLENRITLLNKFATYLKNIYIYSRFKSSALLLYPNSEPIENMSTCENFVGKLLLGYKSFISQIKLLNIHNLRIIIDKKVYKLENHGTCEFCNINEASLFHWIVDCNLLSEERKKFNLLNLNAENSLDLNFYIYSHSMREIRNFKKFVVFILENSLFKNYVLKL